MQNVQNVDVIQTNTKKKKIIIKNKSERAAEWIMKNWKAK